VLVRAESLPPGSFFLSPCFTLWRVRGAAESPPPSFEGASASSSGHDGAATALSPSSAPESSSGALGGAREEAPAEALAPAASPALEGDVEASSSGHDGAATALGPSSAPESSSGALGGAREEAPAEALALAASPALEGDVEASSSGHRVARRGGHLAPGPRPLDGLPRRRAENRIPPPTRLRLRPRWVHAAYQRRRGSRRTRMDQSSRCSFVRRSARSSSGVGGSGGSRWSCGAWPSFPGAGPSSSEVCGFGLAEVSKEGVESSAAGGEASGAKEGAVGGGEASGAKEGAESPVETGPSEAELALAAAAELPTLGRRWGGEKDEATQTAAKARARERVRSSATNSREEENSSLGIVGGRPASGKICDMFAQENNV
jgi:hypothetical protein